MRAFTIDQGAWLRQPVFPRLVLAGAFFVAVASVLQGQDRTAMGVDVDSEVIYRLSPFDLVAVSVYGEEDLRSEQRISDNGMLAMPLLGEVPVGGLTVSQASRLIKRSFIEQQYLKNPVITISIKEFAPKVVTVMGQVEKPGQVEIPPGRNGIPVQIAIAGAGGFTGTARKTDVKVTRQSAGSQNKQTITVNIDKLLEADNRGRGPDVFMVHADDIVFVPRRMF